MTSMFTMEGFFFFFFFCTTPLFWFICCCIVRQWRTSSCPAAALRRQWQTHRYSSPLHADLRASFQFCEPREVRPGAPLRRASFPDEANDAVWHTHPGESKYKRSATSRNITEVMSFFSFVPWWHQWWCCVTNKPRPIRAECEQSCGCDTVRYAVTLSVSGMLVDESAEVATLLFG